MHSFAEADLSRTKLDISPGQCLNIENGKAVEPCYPIPLVSQSFFSSAVGMSENKPVYVKRLLPSSVGESVSHPAAAIRSSRIFQENITMNDGGYSAKNGAREAPVHRLASSGAQLGVGQYDSMSIN